MPSIDVNDVLKRTQGTGDGSNVTFSFSFQVNNTNEIKVYEDSTLKSEGVHYDIVDSSSSAGLNANGTGVVKFKTSPTNYTPADGVKITIVSLMSLARSSVYSSGGNITAGSLETDFDRLHRIAGDFKEVKSRTLVAPEYSPTDIDMTIPSKASRLGKILGFNSSTGNPEMFTYLTNDNVTALDGLTAGTVLASKYVLVDANKDITGFRNITLSGELDAGSLDVSGNADIDGILEADEITVDGTALNEYIADTVGAMVGSNTETGVTVSYEDGDNTLDFVLGSSQTVFETILNTSLVIGRDADNQIKFSTDNQIIFEVDGGDNVIFKTGGEIEASSLDISGNADIDGTLEADNITIEGTALNEYIADTVGAMVGSNTETGISVTYEDADNTLDFVIGSTSITNGMLAGSIADTKLDTITTAGKVSIGALEIDGASDIGADLADADLIIVDDGAGGTEVKSELTRVKKYIYSSLSGDATASDAGALTIANDAVTGAKIADNSINSEHYVDGSIDTAHLSADCITGAKIADNALDSEHYTDGSIDTAHIATGAITADKIADGTVVATEIADNAVTTAKINADAVTGAKIADNAINSEHYTDGSIDTAHIANDQITNALMADDAIDSAQIADGAIDTVHIASSQVTTAKIANDAITEAKIADDAVESEHLNNNVISGQTAITSGLASTDELLFSDAGTIKKMDVSVLTDYYKDLTVTETNKTLTSPKINEDVALTSTATELNLLDGVSGLVQADFTKLASIDATATELNLLDGITGIADENNMSSDSDTKLATQQSIKAYVDANAGGGMSNFILEDGDGTEVTVADGKEVKFVEGGGLDINWTDTSTGSDADPYDLTFTINASQTDITSLTNTSLVIGRDADNDIDFATDNEIIFRANGADKIKLSDGALVPVTDNDIDLGTSSLEFKNAYFDGTVYCDALANHGNTTTYGYIFQSVDNNYIYFGANFEVSLRHVHNTGLLLNGAMQLQFGDSGTYIHQSADGVLDLVSDTEIELNATTIDVNGNLDVSGSLTLGGTLISSSATELNYVDGVTSNIQTQLNSLSSGSGKVLQVVQDTKTDTFSTTSTSFTDITGLSVDITPSSTSNKILVEVQISNNASSTYTKFFDLVRGSTSIFKGDDASDNKIECTVWGRDEANTGGQVYSITYLDSPSSTSELTYKLQGSVQSGGTLTVNKSQSDANASYLGRGTSSITVTEIAG